MKKIKKLLLLSFMLAFVLTCGLTGCSSNKTGGLKRVTNNNKLIVGFTDFPPFGYIEDGEYLGFDLELAKMVCDELDIKMEAKYIDWDTKVMELKTNVDCIWNAMTITEQLKENMIFSNPYWETKLVAIVTDSSNISNVSDLENKKIAVEMGGSADISISDSSSYSVSKYKTVSEALLSINAGQADAVIVDYTYAQNVLKNSNNQYKVIEGTIGNIEEYGIAFRKEETDLRDKVDEIIDKLYKDGKLNALLEKYFGESNGFKR